MTHPLLEDLVARLVSGDRRALARMVTLIENDAPESRSALAQLHARGGHAHIIGITGSPGTGKSTLVTQIVRILRQREMKVAIIAVDPTSPFSGGAILGDRIRMADLTGDPNIYIRSMASRGSVGGLSAKTRDVTRALDAAGFDAIIIETVGAGQAEVEIVRAAQSIIVVTIPGMGDDIQALKAGILETADIFCINKADHPGADQTVAELRMLLSLDQRDGPDKWKPPIIKTIATTGEHASDVVDALANHLKYLHSTGLLITRGEQQARSEILLLLYQTMLGKLDTTIGEEQFQALISSVAVRQADPYSVAKVLAHTIGLAQTE
jgi:LAO/AO transport system kinase